MNQEQERFHRVILEMEKEGDVEPLDPSLEDRLVSRTLQGISAQRSRLRWMTSGAMVAAAAGLAAVLFLHPSDREVPPYQMGITEAHVLGGAAPSLPARAAVALDAILSIELRPQEAAPEGMDALAFFSQEGRVRPWPVTVKRAPNGIFRIQAAVQELRDIHPGQAELIIGIGRSGSSPSPGEIENAVRTEPSAPIKNWQILRQPFEIIRP